VCYIGPPIVLQSDATNVSSLVIEPVESDGFPLARGALRLTKTSVDTLASLVTPYQADTRLTEVAPLLSVSEVRDELVKAGAVIAGNALLRCVLKAGLSHGPLEFGDSSILPDRVIFVRCSAEQTLLIHKMERAGATVEHKERGHEGRVIVRRDEVRYQIVTRRFHAEYADGFGNRMLTYGASIVNGSEGAARYDMSSLVTYNFGTGRWCVGADVPHFGGNRELSLYQNLQVLMYKEGPWEDTDDMQVLMYKDGPLEITVKEDMMSTILGQYYLPTVRIFEVLSIFNIG